MRLYRIIPALPLLAIGLATPATAMGDRCVMVIDPATRQCIANPETGRCLCDRPTASIRDQADRRGEAKARPARPETETPDREPDSRTDPEGYDRWRDRQGKGGL